MPLGQLVLLSVCSFGLYRVYWAYRCWARERDVRGENVSPAWRAWFTPFTLFNLLSRIDLRVAQRGDRGPRLPVGILGATHLALVLVSRLPSPWWLLSFAAVLPFLPAQAAINRVAPLPPRFRLRPLEWGVVVVGGLLLVLALVGTFLPPPEGGPTGSGAEGRA